MLLHAFPADGTVLRELQLVVVEVYLHGDGVGFFRFDDEGQLLFNQLVCPLRFLALYFACFELPDLVPVRQTDIRAF